MIFHLSSIPEMHRTFFFESLPRWSSFLEMRDAHARLRTDDGRVRGHPAKATPSRFEHLRLKTTHLREFSEESGSSMYRCFKSYRNRS